MDHAQLDRANLTALHLRQYRPGDWQAMHALDVLCFGPAFRFSRRAMRGFAEAPGAVTLLAEMEARGAESELAGFCIAQLEGQAGNQSGYQSGSQAGSQTGYVVTLDVAAAWRRRGLARRLMAEVESRLRAAGAVAMELHVFTGNANAIRFYEGIGYEQEGAVEGFYGPGLDALVYRKKLQA